MRRIGIILVFCALWTINGFAASRVSGASGATTSGAAVSTRAGAPKQQVRTQTVNSRQSVRVTPKKQTVSRNATTKANIVTNAARTLTSRAAKQTATTARSGTNVVARATTTETRTGAAYESCKTAYFECMDQFCQLKSDDYRRCSCSDRVTSLQSARDKLTQAGEQLTTFNENLDIVSKTAAQAAAMNTASEGELALTKDKSASKALLTAIMNSIRGDDTKVEHSSLSDLNSIDLSFDSANSFGTADVGQTIAAYNGQALYSAVYPQCRTAVKANCNDASLQRAVNAYLMAIEQDCNTVQTAITNKQKETHAAIRESSSMLDMARAENHKSHNADDIATCLTNVENAILSEEVCGANYHKCLDNGEYIDVTTGAPISGVVDFYKLGTMLTFASGRNNKDQKLAQNINNQVFVSNFEKRVKQFAEPALDRCQDDADTVWQEYLNKALLDIYYAQQSKVAEIKQGCFDFVSACYMNGSEAMTNAMQELAAAYTTVLKPDTNVINKSLCDNYIASCNNMFDGDIVQDYINNRHDTDSLEACRAVLQQCFDNYGGANYENFYNPSSGLFEIGFAPTWFSLYERNTTGKRRCNSTDSGSLSWGTSNCPNGFRYASECARQLASIEACSDPDLIEQAFGGFDYYADYGTTASSIYERYKYDDTIRKLRPTGVATEVYNQIIDILQTQCANLDGKFMNVRNLQLYANNYYQNNFCEARFYCGSGGQNTYGNPDKCRNLNGTGDYTSNYSYLYIDHNNTSINDQIKNRYSVGKYWKLSSAKQFFSQENMCPRDYGTNVDVQSWGACLCWENGGRRSNDGTSARCVPTFPVHPLSHYVLSTVAANSDDANSNDPRITAEQVTTTGLNHPCVIESSDSEDDASYITSVTTDSNNDITSADTTKSFTLWTFKDALNSATSLPTAQDWCTGAVDKHNRVCPFGVLVDYSGSPDSTDPNYNPNYGECNDCPEGYEPNGDYCTDGSISFYKSSILMDPSTISAPSARESVGIFPSGTD